MKNALCAGEDKKPYLYFLKRLPPYEKAFCFELIRKTVAENTRVEYISAYEHFSNAYLAASDSDPDILDQNLTDFIKEAYEEVPDNASPQKISNRMAIATPNVKEKLTRSARPVKSWTKNRMLHPSAPRIQKMGTAFSHQLFTASRSVATKAVVLQLSALLRPGELFSFTWEDVLFQGDLRLQRYRESTTGILIRNAKTAQHIT